MVKDKPLSFAENFSLTGLAACLSKTTAAPIERVKENGFHLSETLPKTCSSYSYINYIEISIIENNHWKF